MMTRNRNILSIKNKKSLPDANSRALLSPQMPPSHSEYLLVFLTHIVLPVSSERANIL